MSKPPNDSKTNITERRKVPSLIIKKNRIMTELDSQSPSPSPKSGDEFRSQRKTIPLRESNKNKNTFFSTPNRYSPLETSITNQNEIINNETKTTTLNNSNNLEPDTHMDTEATQ